MFWPAPEILTLERLRQRDYYELEVSLDSIAGLSSKAETECCLGHKVSRVTRPVLPVLSGGRSFPEWMALRPSQAGAS